VRTAIDSNILSALWSRERFAAEIARTLSDAKNQGGLVMGAPAYAELLAYPRATQVFVDDFLADTGIVVDFEIPQKLWIEAGRRFARCAERRRKSSRQSPRRLLVDFLVGAHALSQADRLMTLDSKLYKQDFPDLKLV
jgi:predicted nucleic acid-binding protein